MVRWSKLNNQRRKADPSYVGMTPKRWGRRVHGAGGTPGLKPKYLRGALRAALKGGAPPTEVEGFHGERSAHPGLDALGFQRAALSFDQKAFFRG